MHPGNAGSNNSLFFQPISSGSLSVRLRPKNLVLPLFFLQSSGIFFAKILSKCFKPLNTLLLDNAEERKGKLVEKRGRKAKGLKLKSHDSRVAETGNTHISPETF